jgi:hypothetical protein
MLVTVFAPNQAPFRFVANDNADLTFGGNVYTSAEVTRGDIATNTEGDKEQITLKMSNRSQVWASYVANNGPILKGCTCLIEDVFLDHIDQGAVWRFQGVIDKLHITISEFNCVVIRDGVNYDEEAPHMDYGPTCQFVFGDARCRATGTPCDQTLTSCDAKGNVTRFAGHPSVPRETVIRGW